ncbi:collagen alpha-2(I) chain-like [Odocoileus virginianus]|uniref:Collagen alpha-2(I) chain-like n=1 Tax=Odocoileus virginianus TaxID=9874 RepID=A0ABM4HQ46_ODOVR
MVFGLDLKLTLPCRNQEDSPKTQDEAEIQIDFGFHDSSSNFQSGSRSSGNILLFPPHLSGARGLGGPVASHGSHSRSGWDVGRLRSGAQEAAGLGASAETSAASGSRGLPPHPGGARAADSARPPRADESGEGAGGGGCGRAEVGGGGGLGAGGAPLAVPAAGRRAAGRSHRAHGVRAFLPSMVTGRGAPGNGQGLAAAQDKRLTEAERRKVFSSAQISTEEIPAEPHDPVAERGVWGRRVGCRAGFQERGHAIATWVRASLPLPTTGRNSPGPAAPTLAASLLLEDADKIQPPPPDSQPPGGVPWPQSCAYSAGIAADKTYRWEQNTRLLGLFSGLEAQKVGKDTPTSRARLSLEPQDSEPGSHQPLDQWGTPADSGFSWSRRCRTCSTPLGLSLIRRCLGWSGSPWRAAPALRERNQTRYLLPTRPWSAHPI